MLAAALHYTELHREGTERRIEAEEAKSGHYETTNTIFEQFNIEVYQ